ncbi:hypothetical protein MishRS11D_30690 [Methylomagnum ishizawai]|nr:hypothetical protein MishRS11D_30690 [Methylomagnum ishizawai]
MAISESPVASLNASAMPLASPAWTPDNALKPTRALRKLGLHQGHGKPGVFLLDAAPDGR